MRHNFATDICTAHMLLLIMNTWLEWRAFQTILKFNIILLAIGDNPW